MNNNNFIYKTPDTSPRDPFGVDSPLTPETTPSIIQPPSIPPPRGLSRPYINHSHSIIYYKTLIQSFYNNTHDPVASIASFTDNFIRNLHNIHSHKQATDLYNTILNDTFNSSLFPDFNHHSHANIKIIIESAYKRIELHYSNIHGGHKSLKKRRKSIKPSKKNNYKNGGMDITWKSGNKKRKTRNKRKGGGNSISSLEELKSHLKNNIEFPTGSRTDPGKHNIDAITRANNKTRNKENKSIYRKSLKKLNNRKKR